MYTMFVCMYVRTYVRTCIRMYQCTFVLYMHYVSMCSNMQVGMDLCIVMTVQMPSVCIPFTIVFDKASCNVVNSAGQKFEIFR